MKFGFDLDGTLDIPAIAGLARTLLGIGHQVHIITAVFEEAGDWQTDEAKHKKLERLCLPFVKYESEDNSSYRGVAQLHVIHAMPASYDRDYRLADLGLRKGALCEQLGIDLFIDDSELFCQMIPRMSGATTVLHVK